MLALLTHPCILLAIGGGLGANSRYWLGVWFKARHLNDHFPWHTFSINVLGSFLLGLVVVFTKDRPAWQMLLGVGFCGGFTTFSTFSLETLALLEKDRIIAALGYALGSVMMGLLVAYIALKAAR